MSRPLILILNGPNLNRLGTREPEIYGATTLSDIEAMCRTACDEYGFDMDFRQSNHEGQLVDWIQEFCDRKGAGVIINAAAYTHTSVAIHDALKLLGKTPIIEVHISNPKEREVFRHFSFIEAVACQHILGQGANGYVMAIHELARRIPKN